MKKKEETVLTQEEIRDFIVHYVSGRRNRFLSYFYSPLKRRKYRHFRHLGYYCRKADFVHIVSNLLIFSHIFDFICGEIVVKLRLFLCLLLASFHAQRPQI